MSTDDLREELLRIGDAAPVADVAPGTWQRARRARTRDRVLAGATVVAVLALVGGLLGLLPSRESTPMAGARGAVPDHIHLVTSTHDVPVTADLAVGRTAAAYVATLGTTGRVVSISAVGGDYHVLDLPFFAERGGLEAASPAPIALSPDGTHLAYAWAGTPPSQRHPAVRTGVAIVDLQSGVTSVFHLSGGKGILVRTISWSPDGRWLVWSGQVSTAWTDRVRRFGDEMAAGRIAPGAESSQPVPASDRVVEAFGIGNSGRVAIMSRDRGLLWDGAVAERTRTPRRWGSPLDIAHVGAYVAAVRSEGSGRGADFHVLRWSGGRQTLTNPDVGDAAMAVRGWLGGTPVIETQPTSGDRTTTALDLLTDDGLREIGRIDAGVEGLTLATDLMTRSQPTADVPAPDWVPRDGTPWWWAGLGATGTLALLLAARLLWRRTHRV